MLFNSIEFILFLVGVVVVYYLIPDQRWRKVFLLVASYYFYANWNAAFLLILLFCTLLSYGSGLLLRRQPDGRLRKATSAATIVLLLLPLACFKYLNFFCAAAGDLLHAAGMDMAVPHFELLLPVGISFFTFMAVGYVADVSMRKTEAESNLLDYALFVGFFPQIASGPIGRAGQLIPQLKQKKLLLYANIAAGAKMMLWGFFMKLVVGDRAGIYVDTVFGNYAHHNGTSLLLATLMYTIQIYCDFAGYSLIAIGSAKTMGIELINNFCRPYFATSIADFWRRWHISLSTWFRDYIYFPLGGSRCAEWKIYRNLMIVFLVSGLWHGAAYTFIIWGAYHGLLQVVERVMKRNNEVGRIRKALRIAITFVLVSYGWMIFYAPDMATVGAITRGYLHPGAPYIHQTTMIFFALGFIILLLKDLKDEYFPERKMLLSSEHVWVRYITFAFLSALIVLFGVLGGGQFIYFKF